MAYTLLTDQHGRLPHIPRIVVPQWGACGGQFRGVYGGDLSFGESGGPYQDSEPPNHKVGQVLHEYPDRTWAH